jgi:hypothetical protein
VLGTLIGGACFSSGPIITRQEARDYVRWLADTDEVWELFKKWEKHPEIRAGDAEIANMLVHDEDGKRADDRPFLRAFWRLFSSLVAGLCAKTSQKNVRTAVRWWAHKDEAWRAS